MKAIVVMNGQFYAGENTRDNKLNFSPDREKAVVVDERRLRQITKSVFNWSLDGTIDLRIFEILEVNGGKEKCVNAVNAKDKLVNVRFVQKRPTVVMPTSMIADGCGSEAKRRE